MQPKLVGGNSKVRFLRKQTGRLKAGWRALSFHAAEKLDFGKPVDDGAGKKAKDRNNQREGRKTNVQVLLADLKKCSKTRDLAKGKQLHAEASICGYDSGNYAATALMTMYAKCGSMLDARQVFDRIQHPDVVCWNVLILGYADNGEGRISLKLFFRMQNECRTPDSVTFMAVVKACSFLAVEGDIKSAECRDMGDAIHNLAEENGCIDVYMQSTLVDMYAKCSSMLDAREVFDSINHPNVVSWTALILGYAENGQGQSGLDLFIKMQAEGPTPNSVTYVAACKACISPTVTEGCMGKVKAIHNLALENGCISDIVLQNTVIDMYAKCGNMVDARQLFDSMMYLTVVSWTALISGYADNGQGHAALDLFTKMRNEGSTPNLATFAAALKACGLVGALEFGRKIHLDINSQNKLDVVVVNCLVDFYAKCGSLVEAQSVFDLHPETRNMITWTALLTGFSNCGDNQAVFRLFEGMQDAGFRPNGVTFLCIFTCCSHAGLVEKGKKYFDAMSIEYGIVPTLEHYNSMLDIFGRANKLDDAVALLECMPCSPNDVTWTIILGNCWKWKNLEIGRLAFESLIKINEKDVAAYVLMGQIYGSRCMWQERNMVMDFSKKLRSCRKPGKSCWTNELGEVHTFLVENCRHPKIREIRDKWKLMDVVMRQHGYTPNLMRGEEVICGHSERLALVCGLINTQPGKTIRIVKNVRVCDECHFVIALISKLECRTIICRDANRIHIFQDGKCSCLHS